MSEQIYNVLIQSGILGAVLIWFMSRLENIIKDNTEMQKKLAESFIIMHDEFISLCRELEKK